MKAIKVSKIVEEDGCLVLDDLPAKKGEKVEVIVLFEEKVSDKQRILGLAGLLFTEQAEEFKEAIREGKTVKEKEVIFDVCS